MFDLVAKTTFWSFTSWSDFLSTSKMNLLPWTSMCPRTGRTGRAWRRTGSPFPPSALLATQTWKISQIWQIFLCKSFGAHIFAVYKSFDIFQLCLPLPPTPRSWGWQPLWGVALRPHLERTGQGLWLWATPPFAKAEHKTGEYQYVVHTAYSFFPQKSS